MTNVSIIGRKVAGSCAARCFASSCPTYSDPMYTAARATSVLFCKGRPAQQQNSETRGRRSLAREHDRLHKRALIARRFPSPAPGPARRAGCRRRPLAAARRGEDGAPVARPAPRRARQQRRHRHAGPEGLAKDGPANRPAEPLVPGAGRPKGRRGAEGGHLPPTARRLLGGTTRERRAPVTLHYHAHKSRWHEARKSYIMRASALDAV
mmetsp:Transcript_69674/g.194367  ORF Transcript_69674/g.194367 Transcript_69674/m.194367 type:complete len:209 (-) Transcript_69674:1377-2003(-)